MIAEEKEAQVQKKLKNEAKIRAGANDVVSDPLIQMGAPILTKNKVKKA